MVGEPGGLQKYIYWSDRRVRNLIADQGVRIVEKRHRKLATPNIRGFLPSVEFAHEVTAHTKPELATKVEDLLGRWAVTDFGSLPPIHYAKGSGRVEFGEFVGAETKRALFYTCERTEDQRTVAICLFGSLENFSDFVVESGAPSQSGWTCSSAMSIYAFLRDECRIVPRADTREGLARDAVKVACSQGEGYSHSSQSVRRYAWNRGYSYGDVMESGEWLAEIYLDLDFSGTLAGPQDGHDRVLIGAPLWLRTPSPQAIRLYSDYDAGELDRMEQQRPVGKWFWPLGSSWI